MQAGTQSPAIAPWHVALSDADFALLRASFVPAFAAHLDDETRASHTRGDGTRDAAERLAVHVVRSWVGREFYRLHLVGGAPVPEGGLASPGHVGGGGSR
ncbi:hypothetical protein MN608_10746 [Microdochium nivale]|nr:hypothetical protein MN608_10746 [Microdochium nivale]